MKYSFYAIISFTLTSLAVLAQPVVVNQKACGTATHAFALAEKDKMIVFGQGVSYRPENMGSMIYFLVAPDNFWVALTAATMNKTNAEGVTKTDQEGNPVRVARACAMITGNGWERVETRDAEIEVGVKQLEKSQKLWMTPDALVRRLERTLGEIPRAQMVASNGDIVTLTVSDAGMWSVVQTEKFSGKAHLVEWGVLFERKNLPAKVPRED